MLKNRFLSVFTLAFAAGIAMPFLPETGTGAVPFLLLAGFAGAAAVFFWAHEHAPELKKLLIYPLIFAIGMSVGAGWLFIRSLPYADFEAYVGLEDTVTGTVTESGSSSESTYMELKLESSVLEVPDGTRVWVYRGGGGLSCRIGDRVTATLTYSALSDSSQRANRVALTADGNVLSVTKGNGTVSSVRYSILQSCEALYTEYGVAGTAQALTVRERTLLSGDVSEAYRNAGLSHLLAISGLHLTVLISALRRLLLRFGIRKQVREVIALLLIVFYCFLTGFSPSILRASMMMGVVLVGELFLEDTDRLTVLFAALLVLLLANPYALLSIGLQLSFLSCLGILLLEPYVSKPVRKIRGSKKVRFYRLRKIPAALVDTFLTSCSAVVFTFPVTVFSFGTVAYISPLTNLMVVPFFSAVLSLVLLSVVIAPFLPSVAAVLAILPGWFLRLTERFLLFLEECGIGSFESDSVWLALPAAFAVAAIFGLLVSYKRGFRMYLSFGVAFAVSLAACALPTVFRADSSLLAVSYAEGYVYVCDGEGSVFLDLGGEASFTLPENDPSCTVQTYIVTAVDDCSPERLELALESGTVETVYLPISSIDGRKNDLSSLKALANQKKCDIIEYHYTVSTELLLFSAREGRVTTSLGATVLLYGDAAAMQDEFLILLPSYTGDVGHFEADTLYVPVSYGGIAVNSNVHLYRDLFLLRDGEVEDP